MGSVNSPRWISHRGYCKHEVENTLGAFDEAVNLGFDRIETDLRVSKDNQIVLCHDETPLRLGGPDKKVQSLTKAELQKIDLKYYTKLVFFDDFVNRYCAKDWIFDIKAETGAETVAALKEWAEYNEGHKLLTSQAWFLFWDPAHEKLLQEFLPSANILANEKQCWRAGLSLYAGMSFLGGFKKGGTYTLPPTTFKKNFFTKKIVDKIHKYKAKALAFLPKTEEETEQAIKAGFDYIITDHPPVRPRRVFSPSRPPFSDNRRGGPRSFDNKGGQNRRPYDNNRSGGQNRRPYDKNRSGGQNKRPYDNRNSNRKPSR